MFLRFRSSAGFYVFYICNYDFYLEALYSCNSIKIRSTTISLKAIIYIYCLSDELFLKNFQRIIQNKNEINFCLFYVIKIALF